MPDFSPSSIPQPRARFNPRRILVRGVNWLGDAVMTTPALQRLRERFPHAHITLSTPEKLAELWLQHPSFDTVLTFGHREGLWSLARRLRAADFDLALVLPNSPRSALAVWLAGIPQRIGYGRRWRNWLLTHRVAPCSGQVPMRKRSAREIRSLIEQNASAPRPSTPTTLPATAHQIFEYLHLVAALGADPSPVGPRLCVTPAETEAAARRFGLALDEQHRSPHLLLGLNPGAEYGPAKRWPIERFIAAAREIQKRTSCTWLVLGGKADVPAADAVVSGLDTRQPTPGTRPSPLLNLAGKTTLRELLVLLKLCRVVLTNDSGPMHVAAALGTSVVVPFGSTSPELTGPGLPQDARHHLLKANAPCSPCFRRTCPIDFRCMSAITVERVVEAVQQAASPP